MGYKVVISERAENHIDQLVSYLMYQLCNPDAAAHLLDEIELVFHRLKNNPFQFPESSDLFLSQYGYREALLHKMDYRIVFRIHLQNVYIIGVFHDLEDYQKKVHAEL